MADIINRYELRGTDRTKLAVNSATRGFRRLDRVVRSVGAGIAAFAVGRFISDAIKAADSVNKLSDRLNVSVSGFSALSFAAEQSGVNVRTLSLGLQRLQRRVSEAAIGTGEAKDALFELGVSAERLNQLRPDEQIEVIAKAFESVTTEADRTRLAFKLFDSEGVSFLQFLRLGQDGLNSLKQEAKDLGVVLDEETAQSATEAVDAIGRIRAQSTAFANELITVLAPAITSAFSGGTRVIKQFEKAGIEAAINVARISVKFNRLFGDDKSLKEAELRFVFLRDRVIEIRKEIERLENGGGVGAAVSGLDASQFLDDSLKGRAAASGSSVSTTAAKAEAEALRIRNQLIAEGEALYQSTLTPIQQVANQFARLEELRAANAISEAKYQAVLQATTEQYQELTKKTDEAAKQQNKILNTVEQKAEEVASGIVSVFTDANKSIKDTLADIGASIANSLFKEFVTGEISGFLSGLFSRRATGGTARKDQPLIVGDGGQPEVFVPNTAGQIMPSVGGQNVTININAIDTQTGTEFLLRNKNAVAGIVRQQAIRQGNRPGF